MHRVALAIILSATSGIALGGPDATANRFLNDTPSMMDFGAYRLEEFLEEFDDLGDITVAYNWDRNRVMVYRVLLLENDDDRDLEEDCRAWMQKVRGKAYVFEGNIFGNRQYTTFADFFGHIGYLRTIAGVEEEDALIDLDKMIVLETQYGRYEESGFSAQLELTCSGSLVDTGFSVSRE